MKIPVEAIGGSTILGFLNEQTNSFVLNQRVPRKIKKAFKKKCPCYKFHKNTLKRVIDFSLKDYSNNSFSLKIAKEKLDNVYHVYLSSYLKSEEDATNRDLIFKTENSDKIFINFKK